MIEEDIVATVTKESVWYTSMIGTSGANEPKPMRSQIDSESAPQDLGIDASSSAPLPPPPPQQD